MKRKCNDRDVQEIPKKCDYARKIQGIVMCTNTKETLRWEYINSTFDIHVHGYNPKRCLEDHFPKKVD
jgi:hypothetical protein